MKKLFIFIVAASTMLSFTGCKKALEAAKEKEIVNAITSGSWYVSKFVEAGTDITTNFSGWDFTYYDNGTSVANKTGNSTVPGTWSGDATTFSFTAAFTSTPPAPLEKLAGTWLVQIVSSDTKASYARTTAGVEYKLELTKK
jgi:hypothetical protein